MSFGELQGLEKDVNYANNNDVDYMDTTIALDFALLLMPDAYSPGY